MRIAVMLALLAFSLSGCAGGSDVSQEMPDLDWTGTFDITTTAVEPFEFAGLNRLQYADGMAGLFVENEDAMPKQAIMVGSEIYTTNTEMSWTHWSMDEFTQSTGRGFRYIVWNPQELLELATAVIIIDGGFTASGTFAVGPQTATFELDVFHVESAISEIVVRTPLGPESPFTIVPAAGPLPFEVALPTTTYTPEEVLEFEPVSRDNHAKIIGWINDYVERLGSVPTTVDAETMQLQRLDEQWPINPFDQQELVNRFASGHFAWYVCSSNDAQYVGYGADAAVLGQSYGAGCEP